MTRQRWQQRYLYSRCRSHQAHGNNWEWTSLNHFTSYPHSSGLRSLWSITSASGWKSRFAVEWWLRLSASFSSRSSAVKDIQGWLSRITVHSFNHSPFRNSWDQEEFPTIGQQSATPRPMVERFNRVFKECVQTIIQEHGDLLQSTWESIEVHHMWRQSFRQLNSCTGAKWGHD